MDYKLIVIILVTLIIFNYLYQDLGSLRKELEQVKKFVKFQSQPVVESCSEAPLTSAAPTCTPVPAPPTSVDGGSGGAGAPSREKPYGKRPPLPIKQQPEQKVVRELGQELAKRGRRSAASDPDPSFDTEYMQQFYPAELPQEVSIGSYGHNLADIDTYQPNMLQYNAGTYHTTSNQSEESDCVINVDMNNTNLTDKVAKIRVKKGDNVKARAKTVEKKKKRNSSDQLLTELKKTIHQNVVIEGPEDSSDDSSGEDDVLQRTPISISRKSGKPEKSQTKTNLKIDTDPDPTSSSGSDAKPRRKLLIRDSSSESGSEDESSSSKSSAKQFRHKMISARR